MINLRPFVWTTLRDYPALQAIHGGRAFQQGGLFTAQTLKPYVVYTMGNNSDEGYADLDSFQPNRQFFQVFIHDDKGDYSRIDQMVELVIEALTSPPWPEGISGIQYLETSQDLDDPTLQTAFRYVRLQAALSR